MFWGMLSVLNATTWEKWLMALRYSGGESNIVNHKDSNLHAVSTARMEFSSNSSDNSNACITGLIQGRLSSIYEPCMRLDQQPMVKIFSSGVGSG